MYLDNEKEENTYGMHIAAEKIKDKKTNFTKKVCRKKKKKKKKKSELNLMLSAIEFTSGVCSPAELDGIMKELLVEELGW